MSIDSIDRASLLRVANLVKPALAGQDYVPALTHIRFDGERATAYNDVSAISVAAPFALRRCVPGDMLIRALGSFAGASVAFASDAAKPDLMLSSGRSKLKLPTLPEADYPFDLPADVSPAVSVTAAILRGIERCMVSVGSDNRNPAEMGVTMAAESGVAVLYSTDGYTMSRYQTDSPLELPGDAPVILPTFFCAQLVALTRAFPDDAVTLVMLSGALMADIGPTTTLFNKTVVDLEPLDFAAALAKHCDPGQAKKRGAPIPDDMDAAFDRALLVLASEVVKTTAVEVAGGRILLHSSSALGESNDDITAANVGRDQKFKVDPALVIRALRGCSRVEFGGRAVVFSDDSGDFVHLVSHTSH